MNIGIIGGGNGGQAMAGHLGMLGHSVILFNRNLDSLRCIVQRKGILLKEKIYGFGPIKSITSDYESVIKKSEIIMVTTVANAHKEVANQIAPFLEDGQIIILNPGRTLGALEFDRVLKRISKKKYYIAEAQSLLYACRSEGNGEVRIIGIKEKVPLAAYPAIETDFVLSKINKIFPSFIKAENILETGLENIGAILHPSIVMFNAATIERGQPFYFYNDMTPAIADFLIEVDKERLHIGKAFGMELLPLSDWISFSYKGIEGRTFCEKIKNNPAYFKIMAPFTLESRLLLEDIPTGVLPFIELAKLVDVKVPLLNAIFIVIQQLLHVNFRDNGRTLRNLGMENIDHAKFKGLL